MDYIKPEVNKESFTCNSCQGYAQQHWDQKALVYNGDKYYIYNLYDARYYSEFIKISLSTCHICQELSIWLDNDLIYPLKSGIEKPNIDMPLEIKELYEEAANVYPISKKSAAALLRLALQLLCKDLGEEGKNINNDIGELIKKGLHPEIAIVLDSIRIVGNQAVHPGELDIEQNDDFVTPLFSLLNFIIDEKYSKPKKHKEFFGKMPLRAIEGTEKRDSKN